MHTQTHAHVYTCSCKRACSIDWWEISKEDNSNHIKNNCKYFWL